MHRLWFEVWQQGQAVESPTQVTRLPRGAQVAGNIAVRRGRDQSLATVYALAADATQARQVWEEAADRLLAA